MYGEIDEFYWNAETVVFLNGNRKTIQNGYVKDASSGHEQSAYISMKSGDFRYIDNIQFETAIDEQQIQLSEICTADEWLAMTEDEQTAYIRNHDNYDADKNAVLYTRQQRSQVGLVGTKDDENGSKAVVGNFSLSYITTSTGSSVKSYRTWWDEQSQYIDGIYINGRIQTVTRYFKGYNSSGSIITTSTTTYDGLSTISFAYHIVQPWKIDANENDGYPFLPDNVIVVKNPMNLPYPNALWRITPYFNDGYPYHLLYPMESGIDMWAMEREHIIHVYDISESQDGFDHNGLAILEPSECVSRKEMNARWDITLTHPLDDWQKWRYLVGQNVLKIDGQLFRIDEVETVCNEDEQYVSVHAAHISYDLADIWIQEASIAASDGTSYFLQLRANRVQPPEAYQDYDFQLYSSITGNLKSEIEDTSLLAAIIGNDDCFVNRYGGELYRDNFFISVEPVMQYSKQNAFSIRYGTNLTYIRQTIDFSTWITDFGTYSNWGQGMWFGYTAGGEWAIHHAKQKRVKLNYGGIDEATDNFSSDSGSLWHNVWIPKVSYEIEIAAIKDNPIYKDFLQLQDFTVGDTGTVYIESLDIYTQQKILYIEKNELTGEIINIKLGNFIESLVRPVYLGNLTSSGHTNADKQNAAIQEQMMDIAFVQTVSTPIVTDFDEFLQTVNDEYILYEE